MVTWYTYVQITMQHKLCGQLTHWYYSCLAIEIHIHSVLETSHANIHQRNDKVMALFSPDSPCVFRENLCHGQCQYDTTPHILLRNGAHLAIVFMACQR